MIWRMRMIGGFLADREEKQNGMGWDDRRDVDGRKR